MYILVTNGRLEENLEQFWLPAQELLGGDSPMLVVFNKHGKIEAKTPINSIKSKYPNVKGQLWVIDLSKDFESLLQFASELEYRVRNLPQFIKGEKLPKSWVAIRNELEKNASNYISLQDYRNLCEKNGIGEIPKQDYLSDYLHDLGILLRYRDNELLNKIVILKPKWALDAIYSVLDHTRGNKTGVFEKRQLLSIWNKKEYIDVTDDLLALMAKFELCFKIDDEEKYLIPFLLPSDQSPDFLWNKVQSTIVKYEYDFMPKGIISRLIVRLNKLINNSEYRLWKEGVVFEYENTRALVTQFANKRIEISAKGQYPFTLLTVICKEIDDINSKYYFSDRMNVKKMIPCNCDKCSQTDIPHYFFYNDILQRDGNGKRTIECANPPYNEVNVKELLDNFENKALKVNTDRKARKMFVSYSKYDEAYLQDFEEHLVTLKTEGLITFNCREIELGKEWDKEIKKQIDECDVMVCLLSVKFLNTDYIGKIEIPKAIEQNKIIIPIIIKACDWEDSELGKYQATQRGKIVSLDNDLKLLGKIKAYTAEEKDAFWTAIIKEFRKKIFS